MSARRTADQTSREMHDEGVTFPQRPARWGKRRLAALLVAAVASVTLAIPPSPAVSSQLPAFSFNRPVEVTNSVSGLRADVMWASVAPFTGAFLWPNNTSRSQEFDALGTHDAFRLRARHSGMCLSLDTRQTTYRNGTLVVQTPCAQNLRSSYWRVRTVGDAVVCNGDTCTSTSAVYPTLQNRYTNKCLDAANPPGGRPPVRAVLQQWSCIGTADDWNAGNQLFSVRNVR